MKFSIKLLLTLCIAGGVLLETKTNPHNSTVTYFPPMGRIRWAENINSPYVTDGILVGIEQLNHSIATNHDYRRSSQRTGHTTVHRVSIRTFEDALLKGRGQTYYDFYRIKREKDNEIYNLRNQLGLAHKPKRMASVGHIYSSPEQHPTYQQQTTPLEQTLFRETGIETLEFTQDTVIDSFYVTPKTREAILLGIRHMNNSLAMQYYYNCTDEQPNKVSIDSIDIQPLATAILQAHQEAKEKFERLMKEKNAEIAELQQQVAAGRIMTWWRNLNRSDRPRPQILAPAEPEPLLSSPAAIDDAGPTAPSTFAQAVVQRQLHLSVTPRDNRQSSLSAEPKSSPAIIAQVDRGLPIAEPVAKHQKTVGQRMASWATPVVTAFAGVAILHKKFAHTPKTPN